MLIVNDDSKWTEWACLQALDRCHLEVLQLAEALIQGHRLGGHGGSDHSFSVLGGAARHVHALDHLAISTAPEPRLTVCWSPSLLSTRERRQSLQKRWPSGHATPSSWSLVHPTSVTAHRSLLVKAATAFDCVAASNRSLLGSFLPLLLFLVRLLLSDLLELFLSGQTWKSVELRPDVTHALALGDNDSPG